jgi:hypothetical protein
VYKRFKPNYSLWPEQARPRRGWPLKFAVGSFMLGVACATVSGFIFTSSGPASGQGPAKQANVERGPIYASAVTPPATPAPAQLETENRSRTRATAKTKLPIIGSQTAVPIGGMDGRGSDVLAGGPPAAGSAASASQPPSLAREESEPAREKPTQEARSEEAEPVTITEPRAEPRTNVFRKKREEPTSLAGAASEPAREPPAREPKSAEAEPATATVWRAEPRKSVRQEREQPTTTLVRESEPAREPPVREARSEEAKPPPRPSDPPTYVKALS